MGVKAASERAADPDGMSCLANALDFPDPDPDPDPDADRA